MQHVGGLIYKTVAFILIIIIVKDFVHIIKFVLENKNESDRNKKEVKKR